MIMLPEQLMDENFNFVLLSEKGKNPIQKGWQKKIIKFNDGEFVEHLKNDGNYGIRSGGKKNLIVVDFDHEMIQTLSINKLPKTFTVKTGSGLLHKYFTSNSLKGFKVFSNEMDTFIDVQGEGRQVVGPNSIHPNGNKYKIMDDSQIAFIDFEVLKKLLMSYDARPKKKDRVLNYTYKDRGDIEELKQRISMKIVLDYIGISTETNLTACPFHDSKGGKCLGFNKEVAHCFHCDCGWNIFSMIMDYKGCNFKEAIKIIKTL